LTSAAFVGVTTVNVPDATGGPIRGLSEMPAMFVVETTAPALAVMVSPTLVPSKMFVGSVEETVSPSSSFSSSLYVHFFANEI